MIAYISSAGLAVLIITIYYIIVYEPRKDPFGKEEDTSTVNNTTTVVDFRPNPIDEIVLHSLWKADRSDHDSSRLEQALIKVRASIAPSVTVLTRTGYIMPERCADSHRLFHPHKRFHSAQN